MKLDFASCANPFAYFAVEKRFDRKGHKAKKEIIAV